MTVAKGQGAMYKLAHDRTNALLAVRRMTEQLIGALERNGKGDEAQLEIALSVLEKRRAKITELENMGRRLNFLVQSGYQPGEEEKAALEREQSTMEALLANNRALEERAAAMMESAQAEAQRGLKEIRDGQKKIQAYGPSLEGHEGSQLDTRR